MPTSISRKQSGWSLSNKSAHFTPPGSFVGTGEKREMTQAEVEKWLAIRKEAGLHIDPDTAEVEWIYALTCDPYGVYPELPEEYQQVGREYFARSPGSDVGSNLATCPKRPKTPYGRNWVGSPLNRGTSIPLCRSDFG